MPILEIALNRLGIAMLSVSVGVDSSRRSAMLKHKHEVPADYTANAIIDTGCNRLVIATSIIDRLGLHPHGSETAVSADGGKKIISLFDARIEFVCGGSIFRYEGLARSHALDPPDFGVLLGAEVFRNSRLVFDYPARSFRAEMP